MASAVTARAAAAAEPAVRPRPQTRRRTRSRVRARGGILWIAISGVLLAGVVFVSVAALRLNLALDKTDSQRTQLRSDVQSLQGQLAAELGSPRIQSQAETQLGVVAVDPSEIGYVNLGK